MSIDYMVRERGRRYCEWKESDERVGFWLVVSKKCTPNNPNKEIGKRYEPKPRKKKNIITLLKENSIYGKEINWN